jgi:hypothetical protein
MFRVFSRPSSGAQWLQWQPLVLPSYRGDSRAVFEKQYHCHHDTMVNPEAAIAVIELLMTGGKTPETCSAVNRRQDNKLKNVCTRLVIYLNCTMMHGLTNLLHGAESPPLIPILSQLHPVPPPPPPPQLPEDPSKYYPPIYVLVSPMASFPQASPPTPCAHLYCPPYAPHALPISFVSILPPAQYWARSTDHTAPMIHGLIKL